MQILKLLRLLLMVGLACGCNQRQQPDIRSETDASGRITSLSFIGRNVVPSDLKQLSQHPGLQALRLQECSALSDQAFAEIKHVAPSLRKLELLRVPLSDDALAHLAPAVSLEELDLAHTNVTGSGLRYLEKTLLKKLTIHSRKVDPIAMAALGELQSLRELELHCQDISLEQLPALGQVKQLESLVAFRTPVGPNGIDVLKGLVHLRKLTLNSVDISDQSVEVLNSLVALEEVELANSLITDEGLKALSLPKLKKLSLDGCTKVTDKGLANLQGMPSVESLMLGGTSVSGVDLTPLSTLRNLKELLLTGKQFKGDAATIEALKALLPNCEVVIMRG